MTDRNQDDYLWNPKAPSDPDVAKLESALSIYRTKEPPALRENDLPRSMAALAPRSRRRFGWPAAAVAAGILLVAAVGVKQRIVRPWALVTVPTGSSWAMGVVGASRHVAPGEWIETDAATQARLNVGSIGKADIGPSSRVRLVRAEGTEHRLSLVEGTLHARIWAPPRFFLVETRTSLAVDLGCVYTLQVSRSGAGWLRVESGEVELVGPRDRVRVPAGNIVHMRETAGPGIPYPSDAPQSFAEAIRDFEDAPADSARVRAILATLPARSTITLWYMLSQVGSGSRADVVRALEQGAPLPADVTREAILQLDRGALDAWRSSMEASWSTERVPGWKRAWRTAWRHVGY